MRLLVLAVCCGASMLLAPVSALAHIGVTPGLLVVDTTQTLLLSVHNDLDRPMTGLAVTAPTGLRIVDAGADDGELWQDVVQDRAVSWRGGPLSANAGSAFTLDIAVDEATAPGPVQLQAEQLYPGGGKLPWQISLTVVPADEESQLLVWAIAGGIVLLATGGIGFVALRRRGRTLQEK